MGISALEFDKLLPSYLVVSKDTVKTESEILKIAKQFNPADVFYIRKQENKKEIVVEDIENLIRRMQYGSVGDKKLFIVFNADLMNTSAQNKLLKTIEDTTNSTIFFLCATENTILPTIKSRSAIIYPKTDGENQTLLQLYKENKDGKEIYENANQLINDCKKLDDALSYLPLLTKPENLTLSFDAIAKSIKKSPFAVDKKQRLYTALSDINRNILANCNPTNAFDLLLLELFN
jgi:DNA polymerase III gamma/tau subunit